MDEETARRMCSLIAGVVCSDGTMSADEREFLKRVMVQCGLPTDTALMPTYREDAAAELAELPAAVREQTLELVILAAAVDGRITPDERALIDAIAAPLGMDEGAVLARLGAALDAS
ncbi:MAG: hypothetical protein R3B72_21545 [Polyangiaceae bacterium]